MGNAKVTCEAEVQVLRANLNWKLGSRLMGSCLALTLILGMTSCDRLSQQIDRMSQRSTDPTQISATSNANAALANTDGPLVEVNTPTSISQLAPHLAKFQPQVRILSPQPDEILSDDRVTVKLALNGLPIFKQPELGLGNHLHVVLDKETYQGVYDLSQPLVFKNLAAGTHTLRVFASRPWHESFKNPGAYALVTFHVLTKTADNNPDPQLPLLTYSRPAGTYGAEPIALDYYLTNAPSHPLAEDSTEQLPDWRIRVTVNDQKFILDRWAPIYLQGFKRGKNLVKLELLDDRGNPIPNVYNNSVNIFTYDPQQQDSLAKLVRGEIDPNLALALVDPNYVADRPAPTPIPTAAVAAVPIQSPAPSPTPSVAPILINTPSPVTTPSVTPVPVKTLSPSPTPSIALVPAIVPTPLSTPSIAVAQRTPAPIFTPPVAAVPAQSSTPIPVPTPAAVPAQSSNPVTTPSVAVIPDRSPATIPTPPVAIASPEIPPTSPTSIVAAPTPSIATAPTQSVPSSIESLPTPITSPHPAIIPTSPSPILVPILPPAKLDPIAVAPIAKTSPVATPTPQIAIEPAKIAPDPVKLAPQTAPSINPMPVFPSAPTPVAQPIAPMPQPATTVEKTWQTKTIEILNIGRAKIREFTNTIPAKAQRFGRNLKIWGTKAIELVQQLRDRKIQDNYSGIPQQTSAE